jgi:hypothetical protein
MGRGGIYPDSSSYFLLTTLFHLLCYIGYVGFPMIRKGLYIVHYLNPGPQMARKPWPKQRIRRRR